MAIPCLTRFIIRSAKTRTILLALTLAIAAFALSPMTAMAKSKSKIHDNTKHSKKKAAVVAAPVQLTPDQAASPAIVSPYRGDPKHILARSAWGNFSEADLFIYLLVSKADVPLLYPQYIAAAPGPERDALRKRVQKALSNIALNADLATETSTAPFDPLDEIRLRLAELPVHEVVWIDRTLAPLNEVRKEDVQKYLIDNPSSTTIPCKASVRYIYLSVPPDAPTATEREAAAKMDRIRDDIASGKLTFEDAARQYSQAPSAANGGLVSDFEPGTFFTTFEDNAFGLDPGAMSPVIFGPNGLYLLQVIGVKPPETIPPGKLEGYIRQKLYFRQMQHRYVYSLAKLREKTIIEDMATLIDTLDPDARVVRAGKFELTADQLWELFPTFVGSDLVINKGVIAGQAERLISLEVIAQFNEKNGQANDPSLVTARRLATDSIRAGKRLREVTENKLAVNTEKEVEGAIAAHPEAFATIAAPRFSLIQIRFLDSSGLSQTRISWEKKEMRRLLEAARDKYASMTLVQVAGGWKGGSIQPSDLIPRNIEDELTKACDRYVQVTRWDPAQVVTDLPKTTQAMLQDMRTRLPEIIKQQTRFLPITEDDDSLSLFYVEQPNLSKPEVRNLQRNVFRQVASQAIGGDAVESLRAERQANGKFELTIP